LFEKVSSAHGRRTLVVRQLKIKNEELKIGGALLFVGGVSGCETGAFWAIFAQNAIAHGLNEPNG
jgi:hypothetical protein